MEAPERITRVQGKRWLIELAWTDDAGDPIDLTGADCRMQLRARCAHDDGTTAPLLDLSVGDGITLGDAEGTILTEVAAEDTEAIPYGLLLAEWEIDLGGGPERLALLEVEVLPEVVREVAQ